MSKKVASILLATIGLLMFIPLFALIAFEKTSVMAFVIMFFVAGAIMLGLVVAYLYKYPVTFGQDSAFDPDSVKVPRTIEGTVVEVATGLLIASAVIIILLNHGLSLNVLWVPLLCSFLLIDVYTPSSIMMIRKLRNAKQVFLAVSMNRTLAVELALAFLLGSIPALQHSGWLLIAIVAVIAVTYIGFHVAISKAS